MTTTTDRITFRVDATLKSDANKLFAELGLDLSTALNMFLSQSVREQKIPFEPRLAAPNRATLKALKEAEAIKSGRLKPKKYANFKDGLKDLGYDL